MSIASEASRLQTAKADLKTAIEGKGVTVPSTTKIDGYADLVDEIPAATESALLSLLKSTVDVSWNDALDEEVSAIIDARQSYSGANLFYNNSHLTGHVTLTKFDHWGGNYSLNNMFYGSRITGVTCLPKAKGTGYQAWGTTFHACSNLTSIKFNSFSVCGYSGNDRSFLAGFTTVVAAQVINVEVEGFLDNSVNMATFINISSISVLNILNSLSTSITGKTFTFGNITIPSSDENYAAISAKVAALTNWTISGLTL